MQARLAGFRQGLERFGWSVGRNVRVDYRFAAANADLAHALGEELISLQPDVLVALATQPARALQKQTRAIPIVFSGVIDPVGAGLITSLAKPGGNLTGTLLYEESIVGKWLAMLKEVSPQLARVAVMTNPKTASQAFNQAAKVFAQSLTIELVPSFVETAAEIEQAIEAFARVPNGGLLVLPDLPGLKNSGVGLLFYLVVVTQLNDAVQFLVNKRFARHAILTGVRPGLSREGLFAGLATSALAALVLAPLYTPFTPLQAGAVGLMIGLFGFIGFVAITAVERDLGVAESRDFLPGHGGLLLRLDSLMFTAPLFFHFVYYLYY